MFVLKVFVYDFWFLSSDPPMMLQPYTSYFELGIETRRNWLGMDFDGWEAPMKLSKPGAKGKGYNE